MPLDFAILGDNGSPTVTVGIGPEAHASCLKTANAAGFYLWQRLADYRADNLFELKELSEFLKQTKALAALLAGSKCESLLQDLCSLIESAQAGHKPVDVLAD